MYEKAVSWDIKEEDAEIIVKIVERAENRHKDVDTLELMMDLTACHLNGCQLDLKALLGYDDFNFAHDVFGISKNICRNTGVLLNCFLPRCSVQR